MRLAPRWQKPLRDLQLRPGRSLLAVLAMAAGLFQLGAMLYAYGMLRPALTTMYSQSLPSAATLVTARVSEAEQDSLRRVPGVADVETHAVTLARLRTEPDEWVPLLLSVVQDFSHQRMDVVTLEQGKWPPGPGEVLLERSAIRFAHVRLGDSVTVRTTGGEDRRVRIAGIVHAAGLAPAWMEHMVPAFVGEDSPLATGATEQLRFTVGAHSGEEGFIHQVADSVRANLERHGHTVARVTVPPPGKHPHADQMAAFLFLLGAFGLLSLVLGAVLTASMVHALLQEQLAQVGVLKAIGATNRQVAGMYLAQVGVLAIASLAVGVPVGLVLGRAYTHFAAGILNADLMHTPFPWGLLAAEIVAGLLVPLLVALTPVWQASRITVREALAGDALAAPTKPPGRTGSWIAGRGLPRPLLISLRTTFARPGRLALSVFTLGLGGAAFLAALDVAEGWNAAVERDFFCRHYDLSVQMADAVPIVTLDRVLRGIPGVVRAEYWAGADPWRIDAKGLPAAQVPLAGPDPASRLLTLPLLEGRALQAGDENVAVVNRALALEDTSLHAGGVIRLRIAGRTVTWPIVGVVKELAPMPVAYAPRASVFALSGGDPDLAHLARIVTAQHDVASVTAVSQRIEQVLAREQLDLAQSQRLTDVKQGLLDHLVIIQSVLTFAALIVVFVGGIALASTLTLSVLQRTREFGVMGAIGATPSRLAMQVWIEGLLTGVLSWLVANALSLPLAWLLETATGNIFLRTPLPFHVGMLPALLWLAGVLVIASCSAAYPAWRAARLTVREALAHV